MVSTPAFLAARLLYIHRRTRSIAVNIHDRTVVTAGILVIESGAIYTFFLAFLMGLYLVGNFAQYIFLDAVSFCFPTSAPMNNLNHGSDNPSHCACISPTQDLSQPHVAQGIVFSLIIVRVGLGISTDAAKARSHLSFVSTLDARGRMGTITGLQATQQSSYGARDYDDHELVPVQGITVTKVVESDALGVVHSVGLPSSSSYYAGDDKLSNV